MSIKNHLLWIALILAVVISVEGSILDLLKPKEENCFTCKPGEKPLLYPLYSYWGKMKDAFVRMFNVALAHAKEYQLT